MPRMMSVRERITLFILSPLLLVACIVGFWAYKNTRFTAEVRFDDSLLATASAIARDIAASGGDALSMDTRDLIGDTSGGQVYYHVYAPDGVFVTGYATPPVSKVQLASETLQFYDAQYHGSAVRVLRLKDAMQIDGLLGTFNFTVWQDTVVREAFVRDQARQTFIVIGTLTASVALIVWFGVGIGLRPILDLQHAISIRSTSDLTPIRRAVPDEVKGVVATLNSLLEQVSESLQAKNVFISNAAHQLRNPVAGILAMAEAVRSAPNAESALERTADLYESARQASDLANKLISFERANRSGNADFHKRVNLVSVVQTAMMQVEHRVPDSIDLRLTPHVADVWISGDALMLEEAVTNLVDNAVKYGGTTLSEIKVDVSTGNKTAQIKVTDNGAGMNKADMSTALERFGQVNPGSGSGLGLSIVQSVTQGHGGNFSFKPCEQGLIALIELPLELASRPLSDSDHYEVKELSASPLEKPST